MRPRCRVGAVAVRLHGEYARFHARRECRNAQYQEFYLWAILMQSVDLLPPLVFR